MKKTIFLGFILLVISQFNVFSQTICDSISIENVVLDFNSIEIQVYNGSQHTIIYPFFTTVLTDNPYITMYDTLQVLSFLSVPGDGNNGFSNALYWNVTFAPASSVPANTVFTGNLVITDPNDSTFSCTKPFSFTYGSAVAATPETELAKLQVFPNPNEGKWTVISPVAQGNIAVYDALGKVVFTQSIKTESSTFEVKNAGIYTVKFESAAGSWTEKICVK
jgi:hypothetical protein